MSSKQEMISNIDINLRKIKWSQYVKFVLIHKDHSKMSYEFLRALVAIELNRSYKFNNTLGLETALQKELVDAHFIEPDTAESNRFVPTQDYNNYVDARFPAQIMSRANAKVRAYHKSNNNPKALENNSHTEASWASVILESMAMLSACSIFVSSCLSDISLGVISSIVMLSSIIAVLFSLNYDRSHNKSHKSSTSTLGTVHPMWYYTATHQEYLTMILDYLHDGDIKIQLFNYELEVSQQIKEANTTMTKTDFVLFLSQHHIWQYNSCNQLPDFIDHNIFKS